MVIIFGIDLGLCVIGYGVICQVGWQLSYLGSGCICIKVDDLLLWLKLIYVGVMEIIIQFQFDYFVIEQVFMVKNVDLVLKFGQVCGVVIVVVINQVLLVFEYVVCQVKQIVVGIGSVEKSQVQYMVCILFKLLVNLQVDVVDVLVIVIIYCYVSQNVVQISEIWFNLVWGCL